MTGKTIIIPTFKKSGEFFLQNQVIMLDDKKITVAAYSVIGSRQNNEDNFLIYYNNGCLLLAVADGMGGPNKGEIASEIAIRTYADTQLGEGFNLEQITQDANTAVYNHGESNANAHGLGTTIAALLLSYKNGVKKKLTGERIHLGDSRIYRYNAEGIEQLTKDHSAVQRDIDEGIITSNEAKTKKYRNIITRCLGKRDSVNTDAHADVEINSGEVYLLCSDGLVGGYMDNNEIQNILDNGGYTNNLAGTAKQLVEQALNLGARDNITVVLAYLEDG